MHNIVLIKNLKKIENLLTYKVRTAILVSEGWEGGKIREIASKKQEF